MGLRDLVMGRPACAAPGSSSSSSSNPLSSFVDAFHGHFPQSEYKKELSSTAIIQKAFDLLKDEMELDQGSIRSMKGTDFVNGHKVADNFILTDCGRSVSVSDKMQKAESSSDQEEVPPASSPAVSVRARL